MSVAEAKAKASLEVADVVRLMELLPHRPPMLLIDRMIDIVANEQHGCSMGQKLHQANDIGRF